MLDDFITDSWLRGLLVSFDCGSGSGVNRHLAKKIYEVGDRDPSE